MTLEERAKEAAEHLWRLHIRGIPEMEAVVLSALKAAVEEETKLFDALATFGNKALMLRKSSDGTWDVFDQSNGLTFKVRNAASAREAVSQIIRASK